MIKKTKHTMQTAFLLSLVALQGATVCNPPQSTDTNNSLLISHATIQIPKKILNKHQTAHSTEPDLEIVVEQ